VSLLTLARALRNAAAIAPFTLSFSRPKAQKDPRDTSNFDQDFTREKPQLTPMDKKVVAKIKQAEFDGFDWAVGQPIGGNHDAVEAAAPQSPSPSAPSQAPAVMAGYDSSSDDDLDGFGEEML